MSNLETEVGWKKKEVRLDDGMLLDLTFVH
jgi:hypothetical protein